MSSQAADQTDVIAANERLTTERDTAIGERDEAVARVTQLEAQLAQANESRNTATNLLTDANQRLANLSADMATVTADRDRLAGIDRDFNRRLAAELAKHGIRAEAIAPGSKAPAAGDLVGQYQAITDSKEKAAFLAKHEKELRALVTSN